MRKLVEIKGIGEVLATAFTEKGFHSVQDIAEATETELATVSGVSTIRAAQLIDSAQTLLTAGAQSESAVQARKSNGDGSLVQTASAASDADDGVLAGKPKGGQAKKKKKGKKKKNKKKLEKDKKNKIKNKKKEKKKDKKSKGKNKKKKSKSGKNK